MASNSLNSSSEALPASDSDMSADESQYGKQDGNRIASVQQENRVLKMELEMYKLRTKSLQEENKALRQASVSIVSFFIYFIQFEIYKEAYEEKEAMPNPMHAMFSWLYLHLLFNLT